MRKLESEKAAIQREVDSAKKPLGPATSSLVPKLRATSGKIDDINTLINLYENKWVRTTSSNHSLQDLFHCIFPKEKHLRFELYSRLCSMFEKEMPRHKSYLLEFPMFAFSPELQPLCFWRSRGRMWTALSLDLKISWSKTAPFLTNRRHCRVANSSCRYYNVMQGQKAQCIPAVRMNFFAGSQKESIRTWTLYFSSNKILCQDLQKSVTSKKDELNKLGRDLDHVGQSCNPLKRGFNEYCPDLFRQEADVKRLKNRYTTVNNQLQERQGLLTQLLHAGKSWLAQLSWISTLPKYTAFMIEGGGFLFIWLSAGVLL